MPVKYATIPSQDLIYFFGYGHCTGQELIHAYEQAMQDPICLPAFSLIFDLSFVNELDIDLQTLHYVINKGKQSPFYAPPPGGGVKIISQNPAMQIIHAAFSFLCLAHAIAIDCHLYPTLDQALRSLGLEEDLHEARSFRADLESSA